MIGAKVVHIKCCWKGGQSWYKQKFGSCNVYLPLHEAYPTYVRDKLVIELTISQ